MTASPVIYHLNHPIQIRRWQDYGVLYHPLSHSTLLINPILFHALQYLMEEPLSLSSITQRLCEGINIQQEEIMSHLESGFDSLCIDGIISVNEAESTISP